MINKSLETPYQYTLRLNIPVTYVIYHILTTDGIKIFYTTSTNIEFIRRGLSSYVHIDEAPLALISSHYIT